MIVYLAALALLTASPSAADEDHQLDGALTELAAAFEAGDMDEAERVHAQMRAVDPASLDQDGFANLVAAGTIAMELMGASDIRDYLTGIRDQAEASGFAREALVLRVMIAETLARSQNWAAVAESSAGVREAYEALGVDDPTLSGRIYLVEGSSALARTEPDTALPLLEQAIMDLERAEEPQRHLIGVGRASKGIAYFMQGRILLAAQAMDAAAHDIAAATQPGVDVRITSFTNAAMVSVQAGLHDQAQYWTRRAIQECTLSASPADACSPVRLHLTLANVELARGDIRAATEASHSALRSVDIMAEGFDNHLRFEAQIMAGVIASLAGRDDEAADWMLAAVRSPDFTNLDQMRQVHAISNTLTALRHAGRLDDALELIEASTHLPESMAVLIERARINLAAGNMAEGNAALTQAEALIDPDSMGTSQAVDVLTARAAFLQAQGQLTEAIAVLRDAVERQAGTFGRSSIQTLFRRYSLGEALMAGGKYDEARTVLAQTAQDLAAVHNFGGSLSVSDTLQPGLFFQREIVSLALVEAIARSTPYPEQTGEMLAAAQLALRRESGDAMRLAREVEGVTPAQRELVSRFESLLQERRGAHRALSASFRTADGQRSSEASEQIESLDSALWATLDELRAEIPRFNYVEATSTVSIDEIQASLGPDETYLLLLHGPEAAYVMAFTDSTTHWHRTGIDGPDICHLVRRIRASMDPEGAPVCHGIPLRDEIPDTQIFDRTAAHELYTALLAPLEAVIAERPHLIISANGALAALPAAALVTAPPRGNDRDNSALRRTAWLINDYAISNLPDPASLVALRERRLTSRPEDGFVGVGAPCVLGLDGACEAREHEELVAALRSVSAQQLRELQPLPGALDELRAMAQEVGGETVLLTGENATVGTLLQTSFTGRRVVAFATHGLTAGELGASEPSLVMSVREDDLPGNGLLTASMIASRLQLDSDWVVLSACNAIGGGVTAANGLARGFFTAGSTRILATQVPIRDDVAVRLSVPVIGGAPARPADKLQHAMITLMSDQNLPGAAHPRVWAGYVVIGVD